MGACCGKGRADSANPHVELRERQCNNIGSGMRQWPVQYIEAWTALPCRGASDVPRDNLGQAMTSSGSLRATRSQMTIQPPG